MLQAEREGGFTIISAVRRGYMVTFQYGIATHLTANIIRWGDKKLYFSNCEKRAVDGYMGTKRNPDTFCFLMALCPAVSSF